MQRFDVQINKAVPGDAFLREWEFQNRELNAGPRVEFNFQGTNIGAVVSTSVGAPWPKADFKRTLQLVLHKVDPTCDVLTLREVSP